MKVFIFISILVAIAAAEFVFKTKEDVEHARIKCQPEAKISEELFEKIKKLEYPNEVSVHNYILCASKDVGFFDEVNGFNIDYITKEIEHFEGEKPEIKQSVEKCIDKNEQKTSVAEWCYRNFVCLMTNTAFKKMFTG